MHEVKIRNGESLPELRRHPEKEEALKKACREFEAVFTHELLKSMRRTIEKCDLFHGGQGEEIYESLLDQELSKKMVGLGPQSLSTLLYRQLQRNEAGGEGLPERTEFRAPPTLPGPMLPGSCLSSSFGWRKDPITKEKQFHNGIDLAAPEGTPVRSPEQGRVIVSDFQEGYGNFVVLDHGRGLNTLYAHNRENKVKEGDWVKRGGLLATVGSTGRSTAPHLHFEVRSNGTVQDPSPFLSANRGMDLGSPPLGSIKKGKEHEIDG